MTLKTTELDAFLDMLSYFIPNVHKPSAAVPWQSHSVSCLKSHEETGALHTQLCFHVTEENFLTR